MPGFSLRASLIALSALSLALAVGLGTASLHGLQAVQAGAEDLRGNLRDRLDNAAGMAIAFNRMRVAEAQHVATSNAPEKQDALGAIQTAQGDFVIVGDTPRDIHAARAFGMRVVAVATGHFSVDALAAHEPDVLLEDLCDPDAFYAALG